MNLSVKTVKVEGPLALVSWYVGMENCGRLEIDLGPTDRDQEVVAELCAIRYLIFQKAVFNCVPKFGQGLRIRVSTGAIRKLINGTSSKKHLRLYALFARPRLEKSVFLVTKEHPPGIAHEQSPEAVRLSDVFYAWFEPFHIQGLGNIHITNHATERYAQRLNEPEVKDPAASLLLRLRHKQFAKQNIPASVLEHKARKYGSGQCVEVWGHPDSTMRFLISRDKPEHGTLLTVFRIEPDQRFL